MPNPKLIRNNGQYLLDMSDGAGTRLGVSDNDPVRGTYSLFVGNFAPAASPTDIVVIQGSATKIVRVRQIIITGTATAAANVNMVVSRRSTPPTAGTSTLVVPGQRNSGNDAPSAVVSLFTVNPTTLGTLVGVTDGGRLNIAPASNGSIDRLLLQYGWLNDQAPALMNANEFLTIGFGQTPVAMPAGGTFDFNIVFSED